jgi:hypothetical protein
MSFSILPSSGIGNGRIRFLHLILRHIIKIVFEGPSEQTKESARRLIQMSKDDPGWMRSKVLLQLRINASIICESGEIKRSQWKRHGSSDWKAF